MKTNKLTIKTLERKINKVGTPIIIVNGKYQTIDNGEKVGETYRYFFANKEKNIICFDSDKEAIYLWASLCWWNYHYMGKLCRKKGSKSMKQALKLIDEIKADYKAINNSKSKYLINDKLKHIKRLKRELREILWLWEYKL